MIRLLPIALLLASCGGSPERQSQLDLLAPDFDREAVVEIQLDLPEGSIHLIKKEKLWVLAEWDHFPADQDFVTFLMDTITKAPAGSMVSNYPNDPRYELRENNRLVTMRDRQGDVLLRLNVGKSTDNFRTVFVEKDDQVWRVSADLYPALARPTWGDRRLWRIPVSQIQTIKATGPDLDFEARQADDVWSLVSPGTLTSHFQEKLLKALPQLRAGGLKYDPDLARQTALDYQLVLTVAGQPFIIWFHIRYGHIEATTGQSSVIYLFPMTFLHDLQNSAAE